MPRFYVKSFASLITPLYQIWDATTDEPVNPLWFYARREDAEARIRKASPGGETKGEGEG